MIEQKGISLAGQTSAGQTSPRYSLLFNIIFFKIFIYTWFGTFYLKSNVWGHAQTASPFFIIFIPLPLTYTKHSMIFSPIIDTYYMPKNSGSYIQQVVECIKVYSTMMQCAFSGFFLGEPPSVFPVKATKKHQLNSSVVWSHITYMPSICSCRLLSNQIT